MKAQKRWRLSEVKRLFVLRDMHELPWKVVAKYLPGHTAAECAAKYHASPQHQRRSSRAGNTLVARRQRFDGNETERNDRFAAVAARNEQAANTGIVTGVFLGDPPPGYSALDQRRRA